MNQRGQLVLVGFMIAVLLFFTVIVMIEGLKEGITIARDANHLDCTNSSITTGTKMTCIFVDAMLPIWIGFGLAIAAAYMGIKEYRNPGQ